MMPVMNAPTFEIVSDLHDFGRQEDGIPFIGEMYYVQATYADGHRLDHFARFSGCRVEYDDLDGRNVFIDSREQAKAAVERLLNRILEAGGALNPVHWNEGRPVYGSASYDPFEEIMLERMEAA
jgi:hypothetical protein